MPEGPPVFTCEEDGQALVTDTHATVLSRGQHGFCRKVFAVGWTGSCVVGAGFEFESERPTVTIDSKGNHFPKSVIL